MMLSTSQMRKLRVTARPKPTAKERQAEDPSCGGNPHLPHPQQFKAPGEVGTGTLRSRVKGDTAGALTHPTAAGR